MSTGMSLAAPAGIAAHGPRPRHVQAGISRGCVLNSSSQSSCHSAGTSTPASRSNRVRRMVPARPRPPQPQSPVHPKMLRTVAVGRFRLHPALEARLRMPGSARRMNRPRGRHHPTLEPGRRQPTRQIRVLVIHEERGIEQPTRCIHRLAPQQDVSGPRIRRLRARSGPKAWSMFK